MVERAHTLDELAAKLRRPARSLSAFGRLSPHQIELLSDAVDAACERQRRTIDAAFQQAISGPLGRLVVAFLRRGGTA